MQSNLLKNQTYIRKTDDKKTRVWKNNEMKTKPVPSTQDAFEIYLNKPSKPQSKLSATKLWKCYEIKNKTYEIKNQTYEIKNQTYVIKTKPIK